MPGDPSSQTFYEKMYAGVADPWAFATSPYEHYRYTRILNALGQRHYQRAFEPGCSIGVLTEQLAFVCAHVEATDISTIAVSRAQDRCRALPNVIIKQGGLPDQIPDGMFDLIIFSEIGYYFDRETLVSLAQNCSTDSEVKACFSPYIGLAYRPITGLPGSRCTSFWRQRSRADQVGAL